MHQLIRKKIYQHAPFSTPNSSHVCNRRNFITLNPILEISQYSIAVKGNFRSANVVGVNTNTSVCIKGKLSTFTK